MVPQKILDFIIDLAAEEVDVESDGQKENDEREEEEYPPLSFQQVKLLRSLSLVSPGCYLRARKHLFAQIRLSLHPCGDRYSTKATPLHNLATLLQSNERLRACPRMLELRIDSEPQEHADLARILAWLPFLRMVRMVWIGQHVFGLHAYVDWKIIPKEVLKALFDLPKTSPHVEILEVCHLKLDVGFVLGWKHMRKLMLNNCGFLQSGPKDDYSLSSLHHLHLTGASHFLDILAARHERATSETFLQSLSIRIWSLYDANMLWSFLSSSLAHSLKTLKVDRPRLMIVAQPTGMPLHLPSLTSLNFRISTFNGAKVEFPEVIALGSCRSQLETITLDIQFDLNASMVALRDAGVGWHIEIAWNALDLALASPQFPCLKGVKARVKYVLGSSGCIDKFHPEAVAQHMADLLTEGELFPRLNSLSRKIDFNVTGTVTWSDE